MKNKITNKRKLNNIYELPEETWRMFEEYNLDPPSEMWEFDIELEMEEDDPPIPDDFLIKFYINAIKEQRYENAGVFKEELVKRGFKITTHSEEEKNNIIITFEKRDGWVKI